MKIIWMMALALGGCGVVPVRPVASAGEYCRISQPIQYDSGRDSAETVAAIERHNSQWSCVCEADCPKPAAIAKEPAPSASNPSP